MIDQVLMGGGLKLLGKVTGSGLVERMGWRGKAEEVVNAGARAGFKAAQAVAPVVARLSRAGARLPARPKPAAFDLGLDEEQQLFEASASRFAMSRFRPAARAADEGCAPPEGLMQSCWQELGLGLMAVPEALGGAGAERAPLSNAIVIEALARGDMALALAAAAPLGVINALVDFGSEAQQARWLAPFNQGDFVPAALALVEPHPLFDPLRLKTRATLKEGQYTLYGSKALVPLGRSAGFFLVAAEILGGGPAIFIVERDARGLSIAHEPSMGLRGADLCRLTLDGVRVPREALLGERAPGWDYGALIDKARIGWGALAVGSSQAVLDYVVEYCNGRVAFGEPITHRQSVAFAIADAATELEGMRLLVQRAASRADVGMPCGREAFLARLQCADKGMKIGADGVQLLGGHGFVKDHPVELWYRHLRAVGLMEGALCV